MGILAAFVVPHPPLLIPEVGERSAHKVQQTENALREVARRAAALEPETFVFFSPHATCYSDYFHISPGTGAEGDFSAFGARAASASYSVRYDQEFILALEALLAERGIPGGTAGERGSVLDHGTLVPLHFLEAAAAADHKVSKASKGAEDSEGKPLQIVRIGLSGLSRKHHKELGRAVFHVAQKLARRTVIIASGDLSHKLRADGPYGYAPEGPAFDELTCASLGEGSLDCLFSLDEELCEAAAECGLRSFLMMAGALEGTEYAAELLSYEGPFGVGYAVVSFLVQAERGSGAAKDVQTSAQKVQLTAPEQTAPDPPSAQRSESLPVALARETLRCWLGANTGARRPTLESPPLKRLLEEYRSVPEGKALYEELAGKRAGAFVSLHKNGKLRGCIGTIAPAQSSVLAEVVHNAVSAGAEDPRFLPVEKEELGQLALKVDILGEAEPVYDRSLLDAERYGVIVSLGRRSGLLLPALEGVETPEEQISIALAKAQIRPEEPYKLERFEVVRYT